MKDLDVFLLRTDGMLQHLGAVISREFINFSRLLAVALVGILRVVAHILCVLTASAAVVRVWH